MGHPLGVVQVPLHRLADAALEGLGRFPAQLALDLARIDRVTPVMAGAVGDVGDLRGVAGTICPGPQLVQQRADRADDFDVGLFVPAAHVVGLAQLAGLEYPADRAAVVLDIEPVAHLHAVAIDRQGFAGQCVDDHERDEFFGEVVGAVVVGAVGGEHRQAVGVVPGAHQVVAGGLAGGIRAVGFVAVGFGKGRFALGQRAVDLVGADMQEAKARLVRVGQSAPVAAHRFKQVKRADDVGLDEFARAMDGAVDVAFGGKVDDRARTVLGQQLRQQRTVADVALHKGVAWVVLQAGQVFQVAGVGELVQVEHWLIYLRQPVQHKVAADETGTARNEDTHDLFRSFQIHRSNRYFVHASNSYIKFCHSEAPLARDNSCHGNAISDW